MDITQLIFSDSHITLKEADGRIVAIMPSANLSMHVGECNYAGVVYLSDATVSRGSDTLKYPIRPENITEPAGVWTAQTLVAYLENIFKNSKSSGVSDVYVQDQTTNLISLYVSRTIASMTLVNDVAKDSNTPTIQTTVAPLVGDWLCMGENRRFAQAEITAVTSLGGGQYRLTLAESFATNFTALGTVGRISNPNMNVNGSTTPVLFTIAPCPTAKLHLVSVMCVMVHASAGDDGLFGNLPKLTNGVRFRKENDQTTQALFNLKDNSELRLEGAEIMYPTRSGGGGSYGTSAHIHLKDDRGAVLQLDGSSAESFDVFIRDNLSALSRFRIKILGHVVMD